jgi:hypothetical protein
MVLLDQMTNRAELPGSASRSAVCVKNEKALIDFLRLKQTNRFM